MAATQLIAVSEDELETVKDMLKNVSNTLTEMKESGVYGNRIYTNKQLMECLGIGDKLIKKYRDDGILSFHKIGDKFWYTEEDVQEFLAQGYVKGYAINQDC